MSNKFYSPSRRETPWTGSDDCNPMQSFIDMQVHALYEERHGRLSESFEVKMFNSIEISSCRCCGSERIKCNGFTSNGIRRYKCRNCGRTFTPVTGTLFNGHKIPIDEWIDFCLQLFSDQSFLSISKSNRNSYTTTRYWVAELALSLSDVQDGIVLSGMVYVDETYFSVVHREKARNEDGTYLRGLSKDQYCFIMACDDSNTVCKLIGRGKPSKKTVMSALEKHINPGSTIIHDGEGAHGMLISRLNLISEVHPTSETKGLDDRHNPLDPINDKCARFKRFLRAHSGFNREYFYQLVNLFIFIINPPANPYEKVEKALFGILNTPNSLTFRDIFCN